MDPIGMLAGAVILAGGYITGLFVGRRRRAEPKPKPAVCDCTHVLAFHDSKTSRCHAMVHWEGQQCRCRQYTGPQPFAGFYAPEISS